MKIKFIIRNLILYYKDIRSLLFSFLGVFISLFIYIFFLKGNLIDSVSKYPNAGKLIDFWMIASLISIVCMTSTLSAFGQKIEDYEKAHNDDYIVNVGLKKGELTYLYILVSIIEGFISTIIFSLVCYIYLFFKYSTGVSLNVFFKVEVIALILIIFSSLLFSIITNYIKSISSFASLSAIVGTLVGFLSASYIVIGALPKSIRQLLKLWPGFDVAALMRRIMTNNIHIPTVFKNHLFKYLGISTNPINDITVTFLWIIILILIIFFINIDIKIPFLNKLTSKNK